MKAEIHNYRGWDIHFDTEEETFICISEGYDRQEKKKSYASITNFIDEFIKENEKFIPFDIVPIPSKHWNALEGKVIGIRKDGRFIVHTKEGKKKQVGEYEEKDYMLLNAENEPLYKELTKNTEKVEILNEERKYILSKFKVVTLKDIKSNYIK